MRVLIITYYWPPAGGSGVQRWLKFAKYLLHFDVTPIIYAPQNPKYPKYDESLLSEISNKIQILHQPIWEPTDLLFWKKSNNGDSGVSNATNSKLLSFVRGNFFIPDPKIFWVNKSVRYLNTFLKQNKVDFIISTGPPHSMHLIAQIIAKKNRIKWLADFRDPWRGLYYNSALKQLPFVKRKNWKLEKLVLSQADCILTVSDFLKKDFIHHAKRVEVITNGYDDESLSTVEGELDKEFSISYIGLLPQQSNPRVLFKVLRKLCDEDEGFSKDLKLNLVGDIADVVLEDLNKNKLLRHTNVKGYVKHQQAISYQKRAQVLLLLIPNVENSQGILTGKLFEYLTAHRPILALGPVNGDLNQILKNTNTGKIFSFEDEEGLENYIKELYDAFKSDSLKVSPRNIHRFHRKNLTKELVSILKSLHS